MAQKLVLFEEVLNGESILKSEETQVICNHVFGECELSLVEYDKTDDLQLWAGDELYKAMSKEHQYMKRNNNRTTLHDVIIPWP